MTTNYFLFLVICAILSMASTIDWKMTRKIPKLPRAKSYIEFKGLYGGSGDVGSGDGDDSGSADGRDDENDDTDEYHNLFKFFSDKIQDSKTTKGVVPVTQKSSTSININPKSTPSVSRRISSPVVTASRTDVSSSSTGLKLSTPSIYQMRENPTVRFTDPRKHAETATKKISRTTTEGFVGFGYPDDEENTDNDLLNSFMWKEGPLILLIVGAVCILVLTLSFVFYVACLLHRRLNSYDQAAKAPILDKVDLHDNELSA